MVGPLMPLPEVVLKTISPRLEPLVVWLKLKFVYAKERKSEVTTASNAIAPRCKK